MNFGDCLLPAQRSAARMCMEPKSSLRSVRILAARPYSAAAGTLIVGRRSCTCTVNGSRSAMAIAQESTFFPERRAVLGDVAFLVQTSDAETASAAVGRVAKVVSCRLRRCTLSGKHSARAFHPRAASGAASFTPGAARKIPRTATPARPCVSGDRWTCYATRSRAAASTV